MKKFTTEDEAETLSRIQKVFNDEEKSGEVVPIFKKALLYGHKIAIKDNIGEYSYNRLYIAAKKLSYQISNLCGKYRHFYILYRFLNFFKNLFT